MVIHTLQRPLPAYQAQQIRVTEFLILRRQKRLRRDVNLHLRLLRCNKSADARDLRPAANHVAGIVYRLG